MKKTFTLLLISFMALSLSSCGIHVSTENADNKKIGITEKYTQATETATENISISEEKTTIGKRYYSWENYMPSTKELDIFDIKQYDTYDEILVNWKSIDEMINFSTSFLNYSYDVEKTEDVRKSEGYTEDSVFIVCTSKNSDKCVYISYGKSNNMYNGFISLYNS